MSNDRPVNPSTPPQDPVPPHPKQAHHDERASHLAELGAMSQLYAHEINNLLTQISARAQLALMRPDDRELADHALQAVGDCCERVNQLTQIFLSPSSVRAGDRPDTDREPIADIHQRVVNTMRDSDRSRLGLTLDDQSDDFVPDLLSILLEQVLSNLILNALRAIDEHPDPGNPAHQLRVSAHLCDPQVCSTWNTPAVKHAMDIVVEDTGVGMNGSQITQLMNGLRVDVPQQNRTQQTPGRFARHGLGMRVCQKLIGTVGGSILCNSTPGQGTSMRIRVPAIKAQSKSQNPSQDQSKRSAA